MARLLLALLLIIAAPAPTIAASAGNVRLLIDVSGSMKNNDPANLRAPGLRLFVNLLPPRATAGVWLFAGDTEALVAPAPASDAWQNLALANSDRIHSRGRFTDIGGALETAIAAWNTGTADTRRDLILLTDGMVDVSREPGANDAARKRILTDILPRLRAREVRVHAIALSNNADRALLQRLALGTGGTLTVAESAATLQQIFLRLFERTVDRQTVPLAGGRFSIDASVEELTLVAFRPAGTAPLRVQPPDTAAFGRDDAPEGVRWVSEPGYDLITVKRPAPGEWRLLGPEDPANRVMIVTDLALRVSRLPSRMIAGERLPLHIRLTDDGKTIVRRQFLDLVTVRATVDSPSETPGNTFILRDNGKDGDQEAGNGIFTLELAPTAGDAGTLTVLTRVDGRTFERENRQRVQVFPEAVVVDQAPGGRDGRVRLIIRPQVDWLAADSIELVAQVPGPEGSPRPVPVKTRGTPPWRVNLDGLPPGSLVSVGLRLKARAASGRYIDAMLPAILVTVPGQPVVDEPVAAETGTNWLLVATVVIGANALICAVVGMGWLLLRRRGAATPAEEDEEDAEIA